VKVVNRSSAVVKTRRTGKTKDIAIRDGGKTSWQKKKNQTNDKPAGLHKISDSEYKRR